MCACAVFSVAVFFILSLTAFATDASTTPTLTLEGNLPGSNKSSTEAGYQEGTGTVGYDMDFEAQYRVFATGGTMTTGYNAAGGTVDEVAKYGLNSHCGLLVNSSRGIIFADKSENFAAVAGEKAKELADQMAKWL